MAIFLGPSESKVLPFPDPTDQAWSSIVKAVRSLEDEAAKTTDLNRLYQLHQRAAECERQIVDVVAYIGARENEIAAKWPESWKPFIKEPV